MVPGARRWAALRAFAGLARRALAVRWGSTRPFKVIWSLTDRCDCRCVVCTIWKKPKGRELSPTEIGATLRAAPWIRWVNLTGGEPFLREDFVDVVRAVVAALPRLAVLDFPTTGQRTQRILEGVQQIAALGVPRFFLTLSLEGPPDLHDRLRGRPGAFEALCDTWARVRRLPGVKAFLGMTLSDQNADQLEAALAAVAARVPGTGWDDVHVNVYTRSAHYYANQDVSVHAPTPGLLRRLEPLRRRRARSWAPAQQIEAAYLRLLPEYLRTGRSPIACLSGRASVFVAANGDVYPCTVYDRCLGNVLERPLGEILDGAVAADAREVIRRDACPGCWSPCEAQPTLVANLPVSLWQRPALRSGKVGARE